MGITTGGSGGERPRRIRRRRRIERGQPQKPFKPVENTFPQQEGLRLGYYKIEEHKDDYLICRGFDPNVRNPAGIVTPSAPQKINIAKPPLLQKTPWHEKTVELIVDGEPTDVTFEYTDEVGKRIARATINEGEEDEVEVEEVQRITMDYFEDDVIVAVQVSRNTWQNFIEINEEKIRNEDGGLMTWIDLNVSGRCWAKTGEEVEEEEEEEEEQ